LMSICVYHVQALVPHMYIYILESNKVMCTYVHSQDIVYVCAQFFSHDTHCILYMPAYIHIYKYIYLHTLGVV